MGSRAKVVLLVCMGTLALAPSAHASLAYMNENGFAEARGEPGEANDMSIRPGEDGVILSDSAGIRPRDDFGCRALSANEVTCLGDAGALYGEDGNDILRDGGLTTSFGAHGGPGDDQLFGGSVDAILNGDANTVLPTDGNDAIAGSSSVRPLAGSHDFNDLINGGGGNDTIDGREGNDHVSGQTGNDSVAGGDGNDNVEVTELRTEDDREVPPDAGTDILSGGAGDDVLRAVLGSDQADGGDGDDYLLGMDTLLGADDKSADGLRCGAGTDRVAVGAKDKVAVGCETLEVGLHCNGVKTCKATGGLTGKAKGAKKTTTVAKINRSISSGYFANFPLAKATKLLGSSSKVALALSVTLRSGKKFVGGNFLSFVYVK